ncbi:MAG: class II fructose-bisphosphatase [Candidatus Latescibacterota bacterium]
MERNLALELVRVTEAAALASARWMGKGNAQEADQAACDAMSLAILSVNIQGTIVIGEKRPHTALSPGKTVGSGGSLEVDIGLDPLESVSSVALGRKNAMSIIAVGEKGAFFQSPVPYMNKIAVGPEAAGTIKITASPLENLVNIADAKRCYVEDLTVCILDRERHQDLIKEVRATGARIQLAPHGDVAPAIATCIKGSGVDVLMGIGGANEGVLAAVALKCMGGDFQGQVYIQDEEDATALKQSGYGRNDKIIKLDDLIKGDNPMFAATGVTKSDVLNGVKFFPGGATTHSLALRARSRTARFIQANHFFDKQPDYT